MNSERNIQSSGKDAAQSMIVAAARSRFKRFGYAKTSMKEIAEDCGMSVANLYRYHDGKLAIGAAVAAAEQAALFAECELAVAAAPGGLVTKLATLFHALIDGTHRQIKSTPLLFELGMTVAREQPEHRQRILQGTEVRIAGILAADGGEAWTASDAGTASRLILLASAPFVLPWMLQTQPFGNPRAQVTPLMKCLVSGLLKSTSPGLAASARPGNPL